MSDDVTSDVAVFYLRSGIYLIGNYQELDIEPKIFLSNCYEIIDGEMQKFPKYTNDNSCLLNTDLVITIGDPSDQILKKFTSLFE